MHNANIETSKRLQDTLGALIAFDEPTTREIQQSTGSMSVSTDISELRQNGYEIDCWQDRKTENGRKIYRYKLLNREPKQMSLSL